MLGISISLGPKSGDTVERKYKHVHHRMKFDLIGQAALELLAVS